MSHPSPDEPESESSFASASARRPVVVGMLLMLGSTALFTGMHATVRHVGSELHPFEVAFFRNLFGLVAVLPLMLRAGLSTMRSRAPSLHFLRAALGLASMLTWFYGLTIVPIAEATALSFTAVIFGSIAAAVVLRERMRLRRWTAVGFGFVGAMIVLRPGVEAISPGALLVLFSAIMWGASMVIVKILSRTDTVVCIVTMNATLLTVVSFPVALSVWTWPTLENLAWLGLIGILGTGAHLAVASAFKLADATALFPVDFARLIWASIIGFAIFSEIPDIWTWAGGSVIFASTCYITYREAKLKRTAVRDAPA